MAGHRQKCDCEAGYSSLNCFSRSQAIEIMVGVGIDPLCLETCSNAVAERVCSCEDFEAKAEDYMWECCSQCDGKSDFTIGGLCGTKYSRGYQSLCLDLYKADYFIYYDGSALALSCRYQYAERTPNDRCFKFQSFSNIDMGIGFGIEVQCMENCLDSKLQESDASRCASFVENERINNSKMFSWYLKTHEQCCTVCGGAIYGWNNRVCALYDTSKAEYDPWWYQN